MKFKQLLWEDNSSPIPKMTYLQVLTPAPFDQISLSKDFRSESPTWSVSFAEDSYWAFYWEGLTLNSNYSLEEVKMFVQAGWEHYICTNFFEG